MDADFLKAHVGDALTKGMSEVNLYQPADPVEFLGQYLLKYVQNAEQDERVSVLLVWAGEAAWSGRCIQIPHRRGPVNSWWWPARHRAPRETNGGRVSLGNPPQATGVLCQLASSEAAGSQ